MLPRLRLNCSYNVRMPEEQITEKRSKAARDLLDEIVGVIGDFSPLGDADPSLDAKLLMDLLNRNFENLDPDGNGIARDELSVCLARPSDYSSDEYTMLYLLGKYFDVVADLSDDEPGRQDTRITQMDKEILGQFLIHSQMNMRQLAEWFKLDQQQRLYSPPPTSSPPKP
jgi:hypothetical protein